MKLKGACIKTHNIGPMVDFYTRLFGDPDGNTVSFFAELP